MLRLWSIILWVILPYSPFFFGDTIPISGQPTISGYQNITFDGTILLSYLMVPYFFSHSMVPFSHVQYQHHIKLYFCHIWWFPYFFTFDGTILTLCSTNITCDCTFITFGSFLIIFLHLMVSFSYCTIPVSHVILLLSHSILLLFFFLHLMVPTSHMTILLSYLVVLFFFFLTFDDTILTLCSTNITCDCTFVTFGGSFFFFSHIW